MSRRKNVDIGKNRYGLDMSYFRNLFDRELNKPLADFTPKELARVLARASRTADPDVMHEPEFLPGMAIVPVDDLDAIAEVVRGMLHTAYQNAMPVCCGKPGQQCCGNPDPEWSAEDMKVMDSLGPIEKRISAMLAAAKERGE